MMIDGSPLDLELDLQLAADDAALPSHADFARWSAAALTGQRQRAVLTVRIVAREESARLNCAYRGQDRPTNVLSFPFEAPPGLPLDDAAQALLGDLVLCADLVRQEAAEQGKSPTAHWAHLVVHGVLHLLGQDHQHEIEAATMEARETRILSELGFPAPYEDS